LNSPGKLSVSFFIKILNEKYKTPYDEEIYQVETFDVVYASSIECFDESAEFEIDILEPFRQQDEFKEMQPGKLYHVFQHGGITPEINNNHETGMEFNGWLNGWLFEQECTMIREVSPAYFF
jgi:hypothetical protein